MPSALSASRDFVSRAVARIRAGVEEQQRRQTQVGPEITVEPFDAKNVSTGAGLLKLGTSIAAARRRQANYQAAQESVELERDKTRAEIARIRAETGYYERRPGTTETAIPAGQQVITQGKYKGWTRTDAEIDLANRRVLDAQAGSQRREANQGRVTAASKALGLIDARAMRLTGSLTERQMAAYQPIIARAAAGDEGALRQIGVDLEAYNNDYATAADKERIFRNAIASLRNTTLERNRTAVNVRWAEPYRRRYQQVINEAAIGAQPTDEETPAAPQIIDYVQDAQGNFVPARP